MRGLALAVDVVQQQSNRLLDLVAPQACDELHEPGLQFASFHLTS